MSASEAQHLANPRCTECRGSGLQFSTQGPHSAAHTCDCIPACKVCNGEGRVLLQDTGIKRLVRCKCQVLPDRVQIFNEANIPARHLDATFEGFNKDIDGAMPGFVGTWRWVNAYDPGAQSNRGLVLHGGVGRGKTHLMAAAIRHLIFQHGVRARFVEFTHLLASLRQGFELGQGQSRTLQALGDIDLLAIDELGKGRSTDWELQVVDELVSRRYNSLRPLLATTNYSPMPSRTSSRTSNLADKSSEQGLMDRVGERVYSRLSEMCDLQQVSGGDYRARSG